MDFPGTGEGITEEFLSDVLGTDVADLVVTPTRVPGALTTGTHLSFRRADGGTPTALFAKSAHASRAVREAPRQAAFYLREVGFYQTLGAERELPVPQCHFAGHADDGSFLLLLEDLGAGRVGNGFRSAVGDVQRVVEELPAIHARWWNGVGLPEATWISGADDPAVVAGHQQELRETVPVTLERFRFDDRFGASMQALAEQFESVAAHWRERPVTLIHGDLHLQQVFFPSESGGRFALFDWQTAIIANPGIDLARVVTMDLTAADRGAHERDLVARYHTGLVAAGVGGYDLDECWHDYRLGQVWSAMMLMIGSPLVPVDLFDRVARASGSSAEEFMSRMSEAWADLELDEFLS